MSAASYANFRAEANQCVLLSCLLMLVPHCIVNFSAFVLISDLMRNIKTVSVSLFCSLSLSVPPMHLSVSLFVYLSIYISIYLSSTYHLSISLFLSLSKSFSITCHYEINVLIPQKKLPFLTISHLFFYKNYFCIIFL